MRRLALVACGIAALAPRFAWAQSADPYFFGDEAALSAGAVTASGRDAGSLWYNPAGLGGMKHTSVSASATTFGVRIRPIPDALRVRLGDRDRRSDLGATDILSVPNSLLFGGALGRRVGFALGLLTTQRDVRAALVAAPEGTTSYDGQIVGVRDRLDLQSDIVEYHAGGGVGIALSSTVRLGFSAFVTYAKTTNTVQYALSLRAPDAADPATTFALVDSRVTHTRVGAAGAFGLQWHASSHLALGLALRLPQMGLSASANGGASATFGSAGGGEPGSATHSPVDVRAAQATGRVLAPARALLGLAYTTGRGTWVEVGMDAAHGLPSTSAGLARRASLNVRVGARVALSPHWILGGGMFTDRAFSRELPVEAAGFRVDYYGLTLGLSKRTPLALVQNPAPDALVLVTTLSLRAAVGVGEARAATIDLEDSGTLGDRSRVVFGDLMPYFGSSVLF